MSSKEATIGEYGRMLFEMIVGPYSPTAVPHWESISKEAEPLVRRLVALNQKMKGGGYKISGYKDENGKISLGEREMIEIAQKKLWGVQASDLKNGDKIWFIDHYEIKMDAIYHSPFDVADVCEGHVYVTTYNGGIEAIEKDQLVLKAPEDFYIFGVGANEKYDREFWLEKAKELGIG